MMRDWRRASLCRPANPWDPRVATRRAAREFEALTTADTVVVPKGADAAAWAAAKDVIRKPAPPYEGRFLHRDFHPGNVCPGRHK